MTALFRQYFYIAFLMGKPQDLPAGARQMQTGVAAGFLTYVLAVSVLHDIGHAIAHALVDLIWSGVFLYIGVRVVNHPGRFEQAFGGLCGAGAVLNLTALPILLNQPLSGAQPPSGLAIFANFLLLVWSLSLLAHVLRHTFEIGILVSIVLAFGYFILQINVMDWLLPVPAS